MLWKYLHYIENEAEESSFNDDPLSVQKNSNSSLENNLCNGGLNTPVSKPSSPMVVEIGDIPSNNPSSIPIRVLINTLGSRRVLK